MHATEVLNEESERGVRTLLNFFLCMINRKGHDIKKDEYM